jgi:hypothetical protein
MAASVVSSFPQYLFFPGIIGSVQLLSTHLITLTSPVTFLLCSQRVIN